MELSHKSLWDSYAETKNNSSRNKIVENYLDLVNKEIIKLRTPAGIERQDIYQFGVMGLIKAVDKCDLDKIEKFESYASIKIKGEILDQLRNYAKLSQGVSRTTLKMIKKMDTIKETLQKNKKDKVDEKEIMEYLNLEEHSFSQLQLKTLIYNGISIDDFFNNPNEKKEYVRNEDAEKRIIEEESLEEIRSNLSKLKDNEKYVIENYYFNQKSKSQIAKELGLSKARISQLHNIGINQIKQFLEDNQG